LVALVVELEFHAIKRSLLFVWICILLAGAILTFRQSSVWNDDFSLYSNMLNVSPRSLEAMVGLSNAYYSSKEYDTSAKYATMALERDVTDYRPYLILGNINFVHGRLNEALQLMLESQNKNPLAPEIHNALGSLYDELGKSGQAVESFKTALRLRPEYFQAYTNLGVTYERVNNLTEAESVLKKALAVNKNYVPAWYNLGIVQYKNNDKQGARLSFAGAVARDPLHADALTNLSIVCKETGDEACYNDTVRRINALGIKSAP
jgi:Flp pilus assembly protein TadD